MNNPNRLPHVLQKRLPGLSISQLEVTLTFKKGNLTIPKRSPAELPGAMAISYPTSCDCFSSGLSPWRDDLSSPLEDVFSSLRSLVFEALAEGLLLLNSQLIWIESSQNSNMVFKTLLNKNCVESCFRSCKTSCWTTSRSLERSTSHSGSSHYAMKVPIVGWVIHAWLSPLSEESYKNSQLQSLYRRGSTSLLTWTNKINICIWENYYPSKTWIKGNLGEGFSCETTICGDKRLRSL